MIGDPMPPNGSLQINNNQTSTPIPQFQVPITPLLIPPDLTPTALKRELISDDANVDDCMPTTPTLGPVPSTNKRLKRCSTILIE